MVEFLRGNLLNAMSEKIDISEKYASMIWDLIRIAYEKKILPPTIECYNLLRYIKDKYPNLFEDEPIDFSLHNVILQWLR